MTVVYKKHIIHLIIVKATLHDIVWDTMQKKFLGISQQHVWTVDLQVEHKQKHHYQQQNR